MNSFDLMFLQYAFVKNKKAFVLTFTSKKEEFAKNLKNMETILQSFKLK